MYFLMAGIALTLLKYFEIGFVADLSWWWVLSPYAMAVAWWAWADTTGYTKRKAMEAMDKKKQERVERQRESLGVGRRNRRG
ncbi:MAG TPA: TIGR04438 family Trp-rich protein [Hydrogenophaga sp.]|uniref:TIGR04438 family Trp-rich protein n=1 Tax=Hydrogenophaga sp. TaxID=1904254 RepID=UPI002BABBF94|nr:TIGR04438 family Trp-rich protein [Hydrogenophaga sp.]HMN93722.1 TIGR04438 family Trp-rich protein [Hydrogenophaga sp.]HMP09161.1 TIGR04438 family Trp-rich protein [Hydrogenophaga sp.]